MAIRAPDGANKVKTSDCKSTLLNVMIQASQFVSNSQLCHLVTNLLNRSQSKSKLLSL